MKKYWDKISEVGKLSIYGTCAVTILCSVIFSLAADPGYSLVWFLVPIAVGLTAATIIATANYEE